jgi:hypothetical protein
MVKQYNLLRMLKESDSLADKTASKMLMQPYAVIVNLKKLYSNQTPENITKMVEIVFGLNHLQQMPIGIVSYFPALNFIMNGIQYISDIETKRLSAPEKEDLVVAGIQKMRIYGDLTVIDQLAGGDLLKWSEVEKMPYQHVFTKLCMEKDRAEIQENYNEIIRLKNTPQNAHS